MPPRNSAQKIATPSRWAVLAITGQRQPSAPKQRAVTAGRAKSPIACRLSGAPQFDMTTQARTSDPIATARSSFRTDR